MAGWDRWNALFAIPPSEDYLSHFQVYGVDLVDSVVRCRSHHSDCMENLYAG